VPSGLVNDDDGGFRSIYGYHDDECVLVLSIISNNF